MNDFTKEELESLLRFCEDDLEEGGEYISDYHANLRNKIQYMIDSYCQHKDYTFMENICDSDILLCNSCNKIFTE